MACTSTSACNNSLDYARGGASLQRGLRRLRRQSHKSADGAQVVTVEGFRIGLALNRTRIDFERNNGDVSLDYLLEGPSVFTAFAIPGLQ